MKPVGRNEIVDYQTYEERRGEIRKSAMAAKDRRRVHVGEYLTFLFESRETIRYQVQEMTRAEKIVRESDILHELETYNELLGGPGELGVTLLIEIADPAERDGRLAAWLDLLERLYLRLEDGRLVRPTFDPRQIGDGRLSSVQYLHFPVEGNLPVAAGSDHSDPLLRHETLLSADTRSALAEDLAE